MKYTPYSFSKLTLFERCPHAWKLQYVDGIKPPSTPEQKLGTVAHKVVETYLNEILNLGVPGDEEILQKIVHKYAESEQLPELLEFRFNVPPLPEKTERCFVERQIALDVKARPVEFDSPEAFLRGRIDFCYQTPYQATIGEVTIVDWKSNLPASPDPRQLALYGILLAFESEAEVFEVIFHGLRQGVSYSQKVAREELRPTWDWICNTVDRIESEKEWPPKPGPHCKWCGFLEMGLCPVAQKIVPVPADVESVNLPEITPPSSLAEAEKLAGFLKVIDVLRDRLREALRPWCTEQGPVSINGEAFGVWETENIEWKTPEAKDSLVQRLLAEGVDREEVWQVLDVSKRGLVSLLKRHKRQDLLPELEALGEPVKRTRLSWKTVSQD